MAHIRNKMQIVGIFSFACFLFCLVVRFLFQFSGIDLVKFLCCQIFAIFLPGLVAGMYFYREGTVIEIVSLGYAIGYCINIVEYFVLYTLHLERFSIILVAIVAIAAIYVLLKKEKDVNYGEENQEIPLLLVFSGYMLINIMSFSANYLPPRYNPLGLAEIPRDLQFWCSNAVSLKNSFFPNAVYFSDTTLFYHYFSSMQIGFLSRLTGIDVVALAFTLYPFGKCILLVGGFNFLLNRFKLEEGKLFLMSLLLFMSGREKRSIVLYSLNMIERSFGFDLGSAFAFWYLATLIFLLREEKFDLKKCGLNLLFWFVLCGVKGPVAVVMIFIPFFYCCLWLVQRKFGRAFGYGGGVAGLFFAVSVVCSGMLRVLGGAQRVNGGLYSLRLYTAKDREYIDRYAQFGKPFRFAYNVIYKMYYSHQAVFLVTLICFVIFLLLIVAKKMEPKNVALASVMFVTTIIGYIMGVVINAGGRSEMYFSMTASLTAIVFDAVAIEQAWQEIKIREHFFRNRFVQLALICLGLYGVFYMLFVSVYGGLAKSLKRGYDMTRGEGDFDGLTFSLDEANVCTWIKEHTDKGAVVINDRSTVGGDTDSYYYGCFSERSSYLEGADLLIYLDLNNKETTMQAEADKRMNLAVRLYGNDITAIIELKEAGVRYVIQNDQITPRFQYDRELLVERYVSGDITVYEIL